MGTIKQLEEEIEKIQERNRRVEGPFVKNWWLKYVHK
jgi:hypothetical protein